MKIFLLIWLATGLVSTEKLDRTYLPPPGSKFSGGSPGDIQVPLEYPKETYLTGQPQLEGTPEIELGTNRRAKPVSNAQSSTQGTGYSKFRNPYTFPKTTTSYVNTQTTTFAPVDGYEGLDQGSGYSNATGAEKTALPKYYQGQTYQPQLNQGQTGSLPTYNEYQGGQNQQSSVALNGITTQRPLFASNRKPEPYLPPVFNKGQTASGKNNLGYTSGPSRQPQGPVNQDGQQFSTTNRPPINQTVAALPANQQNQFIDNVNIATSTVAPQYQGERIGAPNIPNVNQQRFGTTPQQNLNRFPGSNNFATSTVGPQSQDVTPGSEGQNKYVQNQNIPSNTAPQYQNGKRILNPESSLQNQYISSTTPSHYQNSERTVTPGVGQQKNYPIDQKFPSSSQNQYGQQFTTPGSVMQSKNLGNQAVSSTDAPEYQDSQQFFKPGTPQEINSSNLRVFGSRLPNQQNQRYPERQNFKTSTTAPEFHNGQQFVTSGSDKTIQFSGNQNIPSTAAPQYQDVKRIFRPETSQNVFSPNQGVFGSQVPSHQNQNQYIGNGNFPPTIATSQLTDNVQFTTPESIQEKPVQQTEYRSQVQQNYISSTAAPQYQSPESVQQNQYIGNQAIPGSSQFQNEQRLITPKVQVGYDTGLPGQRGSGLQSGSQQFPSIAAPQYQPTFASTLGSKNPGLTDVNRNPAQTNYIERLQSSTIAPQQFLTEKNPQNNNDILNVPGTVPSYQFGTGTQGYGSSTSPDYNQVTSTTSGPFPIGNYTAAVSGVEGQERLDRPQAAADRTAEILNYENVLSPEGYSYSYDTSNGIHADETGVVGDGIRAQGAYSYTGDDGKIYSVFYSADENGFQPRGDHLPTPPPIPEAIQRVIEQANKDMESGISDDGTYNEEKYGYKQYDGNLNRLRSKNKTISPINGADIPNRYENRVSTQNKKQFTPAGETQVYHDDETIDEQDHFNYDSLDDDEDNIGEKEVNNSRFSKKRPTKVKNLAVEDTKRKNKLNFNRHPGGLGKEQGGDMAEDLSISNMSTDHYDSDESHDLGDDTDLINYDLNSRTDFHGTNKYLPKPKETNTFKQSERGRPMLQLDNVKTTAKGVSNKSGRPNNRKPESSQNVSFNDEQDFKDDDRVRKPSRKNKITQKVKEQSKLGQQDTIDNDEEMNSYDTNTDEDYKSFDDKNSPKGNQSHKGRTQYGNRRINKPQKSKNGTYEIFSQNENASTTDEEKGYEYTPPQKKFHPGDAIEFPTRNSVAEIPKNKSQKGSQTTLRPFMTPNIYSNDYDESTDDHLTGTAYGKPLTPLHPSQKETFPGFRQEGNKYSFKVQPEATEGERFGGTIKTIGEYGTTPSLLPSRVQSTSGPRQDIIGHNDYNKRTKIESSRRPNNKIAVSDNPPNTGASTLNDAFPSTTPLPPSVSNGNEYQQQYQTSNKPTNDSSRIHDKITQVNDARRPGTNDGFRTNSQGQIPSTTFRPNYVFGDKTLAPKGSVTKDGIGQPISNTSSKINGVFANAQPGQIEEKFRPDPVTAPTHVMPGVYQGSTTVPGEDFSGPKQPQRFDTETGYYY